ncbi:transmembrane protein, putative [Bodo saltans]|uniref:Transmembrane protein, putative n=1 Tax=Bodo saltans TaxID=75058 RepID=A0A0S4IJR3_BODSA|nr:transmembrane protein, putative [Bodo saltans]|eukprot:CUE92121.1 transmembrane protein, putative [Bodo saltans]
MTLDHSVDDTWIMFWGAYTTVLPDVLLPNQSPEEDEERFFCSCAASAFATKQYNLDMTTLLISVIAATGGCCLVFGT